MAGSTDQQARAEAPPAPARAAAPDPGAGAQGAPAAPHGPAAAASGGGAAPGAPAKVRRSSGRRAWAVRVAAACVVAVAVTGGGYGYVAVTGDEAPAPAPLGPGDVTVRIGIEHSLYDADEIRVVEGTKLRFVVENDDPIGHELITGPPAIHVQHANGTHPQHASVPGEVSVAAGEVGITTFTFDEVGEFEFACHLPSHYEYGMHGIVIVEAA